MKQTRIWITAMLLGALMALPAAFAQKTAEVALRAAMETETVEGDLKSAIEQYRKIAEGSNRAIVAKALIRMAGCYEKLGTAQARNIYERVLRDYPDQKEAAAVARARLGANESAASGSGDRPVWAGPGVDIFGRVSPDGRLFSYVDWSTGDLMLRDLVNGTSHSLTGKKTWTDQDGAFGSFSIFSRDGRHLAYGWGLSPNRDELRVAALLGTALAEPKRVPLSDEYTGIRPYDWSPDGRWIAAHLGRSDHSGLVGLVAVKDGSVRALQSTGWRNPSNMAFSTDGQFVAFDLPASDDVTQRDVFVLAIDGTRGGKVVENPADDTFAGFSPDGRQFLFASNRTGANALWAQPFSNGKLQGHPVKVRPDFGSPWIHGITRSGALYVTKVVSDQDIYFAPVDLAAGRLAGSPVAIQAFPTRGWPTWSADGAQLAFVDCGAFGGGPCAVFIRDMETGQTRKISHGLHYVSPLRWSPDGGSFITSGTDLKGRRGIFRVEALTGETTPVLFAPTSNTHPEWSVDGRKVIYTLEGALLERSLASGDERELSRIPANAGGFSISPGGRHIAYIEESKANQTSRLMVMPPEGGSARALLQVRHPESFGPAFTFSWTLGGSALLVPKRLTADTRSKNSPWELWLVPVSGEAPRKLDIDVTNWDMHAEMSPDGRRIAAMVGKRSFEVWALENFLPKQTASR